jgi:hypothetical protein
MSHLLPKPVRFQAALPAGKILNMTRSELKFGVSLCAIPDATIYADWIAAWLCSLGIGADNRPASDG